MTHTPDSLSSGSSTLSASTASEHSTAPASALVTSTTPAMHASVSWVTEVQFTGISPSGHQLTMDASKQAGASPMELILLGLGGCASYDVVKILQKSRQSIHDVRCELTAHRADAIPAVYTDIHLHFVVTGKQVKDTQVAKAVQLSADKYCSASHMLSAGGVRITHDYEVIEAADAPE